MKLRQLFADEDAVSPVIGVILMVAITVILAAVIGTFVLGLGQNVNSSAPQANFQFEYSDTNGGGLTGTAGDEVQITHTGGQDVDAANVEVTQSGGTSLSGTGFSSTISTGTSATYTGANAGETIRVVWTSPSGGSSQTIGQSEVPS